MVSHPQIEKVKSADYEARRKNLHAALNTLHATIRRETEQQLFLDLSWQGYRSRADIRQYSTGSSISAKLCDVSSKEASTIKEHLQGRVQRGPVKLFVHEEPTPNIALGLALLDCEVTVLIAALHYFFENLNECRKTLIASQMPTVYNWIDDNCLPVPTTRKEEHDVTQ